MVHAELTVAAVVVRDERYLVVEEYARGARVINQPAGHVEPGETIVDAVIRETREETAWGFTPTGLVGMYYWPHEDGRTTLRFAFCGTVGDHAPEQPLDEGIVAAHWLSASDLAARENLRSPLVLRAIEDFGSQPPLPLERVRHIRADA
ncbi:NUDIX hydrolase [Salinisphaera orenii]|uniref:NUDIX hydrolase n=1 Tax=Salinisphaera orenii TaxID=856731 RepID=UPI0016197E27|nr:MULTISPECIES: NUDIX hydrolase [Salinisphaera]